MLELARAWGAREKSRFFAETDALRVFHGPGEGTGIFSNLAIDRFGSHYWVTEWESGSSGPRNWKAALKDVERFLRGKNAESAVWLKRPEKGLPAEPEVLFGSPPRERFTVKEAGASYRIQLLGARHPGLFLDHAPLRQWLRARCAGMNVLNTFAYTGSLSVAAGLGGATEVVTLDLSRPSVQWAEENWKANALPDSSGRFIAGDVFEWLPRLKREGKRFDCVILDPPSFSRGKKGNFSTDRDLGKLHQLAMALLQPEGFLVSSINSAKIPFQRFETEIHEAARSAGFLFQILARMDLPESFPTALGDKEGRYLKGLILRRT